MWMHRRTLRYHRSLTGQHAVCKDMQQPNTSLYDFIERMQCLEQSTSKPWVCDAECPEKCIDEDIVLTASKVPWPHPSYQLSFYNRYVRNQPYQVVSSTTTTYPTWFLLIRKEHLICWSTHHWSNRRCWKRISCRSDYILIFDKEWSVYIYPAQAKKKHMGPLFTSMV